MADRRSAKGPNPSAGGAARLAGDVPLPLLAALAVCAGMFFNGFDDAAGQAIACLLGATLLALCLASRPPALAAWRAILPVLVPACLAWLWLAGIAMVGDPVAPDLQLAGLSSYAAGLTVLLAGWWIGRHPALIDPTIGWLVALGSLHVLLGRLLVLSGAAGEFGYWTAVRDDRFQGLIGNVNVTATVSGVIVLLAWSRLLAIRRRPRGLGGWAPIAGWALAAVGGGVATIATASRLPVVGLVTLAALLGIARVRLAGRPVLIPALLLAGFAAALLATLVVFVDRLHSRFSILSDSFALRTAIWAHDLDLAGDAPWTGYGVNGYPAAAAHLSTDAQTAQTIWMVNSAHNLPLQLLVTGGLPYLMLLTVAALGWLVAVVRRLRRNWWIEDLGLIAAIALVLLVAEVDIALDVPIGIVTFLFLAGILWGRALGSVPTGIVQPRLPPPQQNLAVAVG